MRRVYPRVCGGTTCWYSLPRDTAGLSPRVRGNHSESREGGWQRGSIPACAGEPCRRRRSRRPDRVYPRVCGGTVDLARSPSGIAGLSPRVRGNPLSPERRDLERGSIPACAGEPDPGRRGPHRPGVYPRVCGGTRPVERHVLGLRGLSPRVRGNQSVSFSSSFIPGSIPACAGEPHIHILSRQVLWVYPRVCGGTSDST